MKKIRNKLTSPLTIFAAAMVISTLGVQVLAQDELGFGFRDNFESDDFSSWSGIAEGAKATVTRVKSRPYDGRYCARFTSNNDAVYCYNFVYDQAAYYSVEYYIRVSASSIVADNTSVFSCSLMESDSGEPVFSFGWKRVAGIIRWTIISRNYGMWESTTINGTSPSPNQWYKVDIVYMPIVGGLLTVSVDDDLLHQGVVCIEEGNAYSISAVAVGIISSFACKTVRIYVDDFYMWYGLE